MDSGISSARSTGTVPWSATSTGTVPWNPHHSGCDDDDDGGGEERTKTTADGWSDQLVGPLGGHDEKCDVGGGSARSDWIRPPVSPLLGGVGGTAAAANRQQEEAAAPRTQPAWGEDDVIL